ncbi:MAG: hypothetical protein K6T90_06165 [Leptolyngbyaceae cyanobacterium HOT.MB2.61]|nr:hypothetical protein [Leptolyngbyaceae cyanobacterium HOT.MB2.61]
MSLATRSSAAPQTVTVLKREDIPAERFQIVYVGGDSSASTPICTFPTQGEAISWLLCNGYTWIKDSNPQQWVKS